jgi:uncharacterized protein
MSSQRIAKSSTPWFREPWPWILMAGPATAVVAGIITVVLALRTHDGLVADDYYKQGMAVNKSIIRDRIAHERGYVANASVQTRDDGAVTLTLSVSDNMPNADDLQLSLSHATRSNKDRVLTLRRGAGGGFVTTLDKLDDGKWYITLEDAFKEWRLTGDLVVRSGVVPHFQLGTQTTAARGN